MINGEENTQENENTEIMNKILHYKDKRLYTGDVLTQEGKFLRHGFGIMIYIVDGEQIESYKGKWEYDKMEGDGIYKFINGDVYEGEFKQGQMNGKGKYTFKNGEILEGNWESNIPQNQNSFKGQVNIEGEFVDGVYEEDKQLEIRLEKIKQSKISEARDEVEQLLIQLKEALILPKKEMLQITKNMFSANFKNETSEFYQGKLVKFEDYKPELWQFILENSFDLSVLEDITQAKLVEKEAIYQQLQKYGQIVEAEKTFYQSEAWSEGVANLAFCRLKDHFVIIKTEITLKPLKKSKQLINEDQTAKPILR